MPFYLNLPSNRVYENVEGEEVLVQGVIDLYFIDKENKLVLLDYKTDRIKDEKELFERYNEQLELYKMALEKALNKKVDEIYIYSTHLGREINIANS